MTVPAGTSLISQGVTPDYLVIIQEGSVEISVPVGEKAVRLSVAGKGKILGLRATLAGAQPEIEATALEECTLLRIPTQHFLETLKQHPEMYFAIAKILSHDLHVAERFLRHAPRRAAKSRHSDSRYAGC